MLLVTAIILTKQPWTSHGIIQTPGVLQLSALIALHPKKTGTLAESSEDDLALRKAGKDMRVGITEGRLKLSHAIPQR